MFETTAAAGNAIHMVDFSAIVDSLSGSTVSDVLNFFDLSSSDLY